METETDPKGQNKGQSLDSKPGQSKTVSEARAGAKGCARGALGTQISFEGLAAALAAFVPAHCTRELSGPGVP